MFSSQSSAGKQTIDRMVTTFKALSGLAEFDGQAPTAASGAAPQVPAPVIAPGGTPLAAPERQAAGLTVNVNIQLTLPETTDSKVFDAFFKSMKQHLLTEDGA